MALDSTPVYISDILPRDVCVECDTSKPLVCPSCTSDQYCKFVLPTDCTQCAKAECVANLPSSTSSSSNGSPSAGAIAGGVIGGVAVIGIITYLVWRFCIKTRRTPVIQETWEDEQMPTHAAAVEKDRDFETMRSDRMSTHTMGSIASTVLTRASNIIQIAYIPGVTNRATPTSPGVLVPPVPPIPIATSQPNSPAATEDQHFFVPGDLRDSTYSAMSGYTDRTSYGRTSYAPRSSVASTIYGKNAVIVAPAQTGMRAKPAMVSVKSGSSGSTAGAVTPPVPTVDYDKYQALRPASPSPSAFSVGSTFLNNATTHTATPARAMLVRVASVGSGAKKVKKEASTGELTSSPAAGSSSLIDDSPIPNQGPFADPPVSDSASRQSSTSLSAVIEEATRRASGRTASSTPSSGRGRSPFGDEHATKN